MWQVFLPLSLFFCCFMTSTSGIDVESLTPFNLPEVKYSDLLGLDTSAIGNLIQDLTEKGVIQITEIPRFAEARKAALQSAGECLKKEATEKRVMADGSIRYSTGAATIDGIRQSMDTQCGESASQLRALIDAACRQLFHAFDSKIPKGSLPIMKPAYQSFSQLMNRGAHLEHLHTYFPTSSSSASSTSEMTMDFHTDSGLMIAMTTGYFSNGQPSPRSGLYLSIPDGPHREKKVKAVMQDDALIIFMGEGSKNWLRPALGKPFRPVPHALIVDFAPDSQNSRSWFGKMYLPPPDAILPIEQVPYSRQRQYESDYQSSKYTSASPLSCGGSDYAQVILQNQPCEKDGVAGVYCWTQCQSVADLPCGQNAVCVNMNTGEVIENGYETHCMDNGKSFCQLECVSSDANTTSSDYCYGYGTTMSMSGFFSIVQEDKGSSPCVNLLFDTWTLDNATKFAFACLGVFALGIFIQYLTLLRAKTKRIEDFWLRRFAKVLLFGVQVVLSYFIMLVTMTYNAELFSMVVVGLTVGYGLFHSGDETDPTVITADSCCPPEKGYDRLDDGDVINPI